MFSTIGSLYVFKTWDRDDATRDRARMREAVAVAGVARDGTAMRPAPVLGAR